VLERGLPIVLELGVLSTALLVLAWDLLRAGRASGRAAVTIGTVGLLAVLAASFGIRASGAIGSGWIQDRFAIYVKQVLLGAGILTLVAVRPYATRHGFAHRLGDTTVLLLFSLLGGMALVSAREFLTLFVAFELLSIPVYALAAADKRSPDAPEGALKIFLFGSLSSAALVLGIAVLFAATGTTFWAEAAAAPRTPLVDLGLMLLLVGFGFKVAMFPFYMWVPDTYQAAPTPFVAFLSVAPKAAGIAALFRLWFDVLEGWTPAMASWLAVIAAATMVLGNVLALPQTNLKRLLAYSGVAHVGYVLAALAAGTSFGAGMALFYFVVYLFSNAGAFLALAALESAGEEPTLAGVRNLVRRAPAMAAAWLAFLLSLGGIPFVLGFWGKLYVFLAAGRAGLWWLVMLGALLSVVALYYYLNVVRAMFLVADDRPPLAVPRALALAVLVCAVVVAAGGLVPQLFVEPALRAVAGF
jgi:NADH-quinone oxidoreductase subunit N